MNQQSNAGLLYILRICKNVVEWLKKKCSVLAWKECLLVRQGTAECTGHTDVSDQREKWDIHLKNIKFYSTGLKEERGGTLSHMKMQAKPN